MSSSRKPRKRFSKERKISHGPNTLKTSAIVSDRIQRYFIDLIELVVSFVKLGRRGFCCLEIVKNPDGVKLYVYDLVNHTGRHGGRLCVLFHIAQEALRFLGHSQYTDIIDKSDQRIRTGFLREQTVSLQKIANALTRRASRAALVTPLNQPHGSGWLF